MESKKLLLFSCLTFGIGLIANAQLVNNATQPIFGFASAPLNTGLAIAPGLDAHAAVYDDGSGNYQIDWIESISSSIVDSEGSIGDDPDVAYNYDGSALVVASTTNNSIFIDEYVLIGGPADYTLSSNNFIYDGIYPNVDVNSGGRGVVCWELNGDVLVTPFLLAPNFSPGPPVQPINIGTGTQPDVVIMDDGSTVGLTYIDPSGALIVRLIDYNSIWTPTYIGLAQWAFPPQFSANYEFPRIASQRNSAFSGPTDFTVVAQEFNGANTDVFGFVFNGASLANPYVHINDYFMGCSTFDPRPVVAYDRDYIHVAWSQDYQGGCSGLPQSNPNNENDVLLRILDIGGNPTGDLEEVNTLQSNFASISRTSIATEYDGAYSIHDFNYNEALIFNDPGDLLWKGRGAATVPVFMDEHNIMTEQESIFSLATSPVGQTIEVVSKSEELATFQLLDNAGRIVELKTISKNENNYSIDISHLSGGIYLLNCASEAGNEVLRVLQVAK